MERMGPRRAGDENGPATPGRPGAVRTAAATVAAATALVAALAGCSVTVQPKNAAVTRPLTSSTPAPTPTSPAAGSSTAPSTSAATTTAASPSTTPSDVDHTVCANVREIMANLKTKLVADKDSDSRTSQDYRTAGTALRVQDTKTDNSDLRSTLKSAGSYYQAAGKDISNGDSPDSDLGKAIDASKPLSTLCGGGGASGSSSTPSSSSSN